MNVTITIHRDIYPDGKQEPLISDSTTYADASLNLPHISVAYIETSCTVTQYTGTEQNQKFKQISSLCTTAQDSYINKTQPNQTPKHRVSFGRENYHTNAAADQRELHSVVRPGKGDYIVPRGNATRRRSVSRRDIGGVCV